MYLSDIEPMLGETVTALSQYLFLNAVTML